jgi:hypothetical protein
MLLIIEIISIATSKMFRVYIMPSVKIQMGNLVLSGAGGIRYSLIKKFSWQDFFKVPQDVIIVG